MFRVIEARKQIVKSGKKETMETGVICKGYMSYRVIALAGHIPCVVLRWRMTWDSDALTPVTYIHLHPVDIHTRAIWGQISCPRKNQINCDCPISQITQLSQGAPSLLRNLFLTRTTHQKKHNKPEHFRNLGERQTCNKYWVYRY